MARTAPSQRTCCFQSDGVVKYPRFCCILQSMYQPGALANYPTDCESWTLGAHIIPHRFDVSRLRHVLGWSSETRESEANALPLCKEFEVAFDKKQLCFLYDGSDWRVRVCDPSLQGPIVLTDRQSKLPTKFQPSNLTWDAVDNQKVTLAPCVSRKALIYHAHCTCTTHPHVAMPPVSYRGDQTRSGAPPEDITQWLAAVQLPGARGEEATTAEQPRPPKTTRD
eukprot:PhM_4_TR18694/c3_g3_i5/m.98710